MSRRRFSPLDRVLGRIDDLDAQNLAILARRLERTLGSPVQVIGVDEDTALVGEPGEDPRAPWSFRARGRQSAWRIDHDRKHRINGTIALQVGTGTDVA